MRSDQSNPPNHPDACQALYQALLRRSVYSSPCTWIRLLDITPHCDKYHDLSTLRKLYQNALGEDGMYRIRECVESMRDQRIAQQVCMHYHAHSHATLTKALSWKSWWQSWWDLSN